MFAPNSASISFAAHLVMRTASTQVHHHDNCVEPLPCAARPKRQRLMLSRSQPIARFAIDFHTYCDRPVRDPVATNHIRFDLDFLIDASVPAVVATRLAHGFRAEVVKLPQKTRVVGIFMSRIGPGSRLCRSGGALIPRSAPTRRGPRWFIVVRAVGHRPRVWPTAFRLAARVA